MMSKLICILLICVFQIVIIAAFTCEKSANTVTELLNEERLKDDLMCNYEKYFLPLKNRSAEMDITIDMNITKYWISMSSPETLHLQTIMTVSWIDINLKWSPSEYDSINEMIVDTADIWKPEIMPQEMEVFSNAPSILESSKCKVKSNGSVTCRTSSSHYGYCKSDLYNWPYEIHECAVQYMLWAHNGEFIKTDVDENKTVHINDQNEEWKIIDTQIESYYMKPEVNIFVSEMYFYFQVRQDMNNSIQLFRIKLFTLISLTILSFWIYFDETSRLVLILMNILCHFYEMDLFQWHITTTGHTVPYFLACYRDSLVLTFVQLVVTIVLKKIFESEKPIPYLITLISSALNYNIIKQILLIQDSMVHETENEIENENDIEYIKRNERNKRKVEILFVDRAFFFIVLVVYIVMVITIISTTFNV